jgi:hypothetical protein
MKSDFHSVVAIIASRSWRAASDARFKITVVSRLPLGRYSDIAGVFTFGFALRERGLVPVSPTG